MIRNLINFLLFFFIIIFFYYVFTYYQSDINIKNINLKRNSIEKRINEQRNNIPKLKSDTSNVIEFNDDLNLIKIENKRNFWNLLKIK